MGTQQTNKQREKRFLQPRKKKKKGKKKKGANINKAAVVSCLQVGEQCVLGETGQSNHILHSG
jgi:hypothetical protein